MDIPLPLGILPSQLQSPHAQIARMRLLKLAKKVPGFPQLHPSQVGVLGLFDLDCFFFLGSYIVRHCILVLDTLLSRNQY